MGWTVHDVKRASVWEFFMAWQGYVDANTPKQPNALSADDKDYIWSRMQELDAPSSTTLSTQTYVLDGPWLVPGEVVTFEVR